MKEKEQVKQLTDMVNELPKEQWQATLDQAFGSYFSVWSLTMPSSDVMTPSAYGIACERLGIQANIELLQKKSNSTGYPSPSHIGSPKNLVDAINLYIDSCASELYVWLSKSMTIDQVKVDPKMESLRTHLFQYEPNTRAKEVLAEQEYLAREEMTGTIDEIIDRIRKIHRFGCPELKNELIHDVISLNAGERSETSFFTSTVECVKDQTMENGQEKSEHREKYKLVTYRRI
jgi:hypothetical protein